LQAHHCLQGIEEPFHKPFSQRRADDTDRPVARVVEKETTEREIQPAITPAVHTSAAKDTAVSTGVMDAQAREVGEVVELAEGSVKGVKDESSDATRAKIRKSGSVKLRRKVNKKYSWTSDLHFQRQPAWKCEGVDTSHCDGNKRWCWALHQAPVFPRRNSDP